MAGPILSADLVRRFPGGPPIEARLALDLGGGEVLGLFGPSGAGKTTILRCLAGLERPDEGRIVAGDEVWLDASRRVAVPPQRRRIGYLPQGYALFPHLSVCDNLAYGIDGLDRRARERRVGELVELLGLAGLEERRPGELSGGQQQRVALGRALARQPLLLLLDEPLSALDAPTREELRLELRRLLERLRIPAIVVTHDRTEALVLADRLAVVVDGRIRQEGPALEVFARPADPDVARIVGADAIAHGVVEASAGGLAVVAIGERRLVAPSELPAGAAVLVTLRPEDVTLVRAVAALAGLSARNRLPGRVVGVEPLGPLVRVRLDCGFELRALVTRDAFADLGVGIGVPLDGVVKASAIHLIPVAA